MHTYSLIPALFFAAAATELGAQQALAVSPGDRAALEGSSYTHYPLGRANSRVQTLHDDIPAGSLITGHAYRRDATGLRGQVTGFQSDLEVTLSISPNPAAQASPVFANNVGPSPIVVLPRTLLTFASTDRPSLDPARTFELMIPYAVPFLVPTTGGTVCVDVAVFGNQSANVSNQNLGVYLDSHQQYADGRAVQPGFRFGQGCPAPGQATDCYAWFDLWRLANSTTELDISVRDGVPDPGTGTTRAFFMLGTRLAGSPWPMRSDCPFYSSAETWFALPGTMTAAGTYDGSLGSMPLLPPGFRLWLQAGSIDLNTAAIAFSDGSTLITPPFGSLPIPSARVANGNDQTALTGTVSRSVPVMAFY